MSFTRMLPLVLSALLLTTAGCKKDPENPAPTGVKIDILQGDNVRDTIGHMAHQRLLLRVTRNGKPATNFRIYYRNDNDCNVPLGSYDGYFVNLWRDTVSLRWTLSGDVGLQHLTLRAVDSVGVEQARTQATATGIRAAGGWHPAACFPGGANALAQGSSGRLFAILSTYANPYYSDDNGVTWHVAAGFGQVPLKYSLDRLVTTPQGEVFVAGRALAVGTPGGLFYSPDNGQTWQDRTAGLGVPGFFTSLTYTRGGKLYASYFGGGLYVSANKGASWTQLPYPSLRSPYYNITETDNGTVYATDYNGELVRSADAGQTWQNIPVPGGPDYRHFYATGSEELFIASYGLLFRSANRGQTWNLIYTAPQVPGLSLQIEHITKRNNVLFFTVNSGGVFSTSDYATYQYAAPKWLGGAYLFTPNGALLANGGRKLNEAYRLHYNQNP